MNEKKKFRKRKKRELKKKQLKAQKNLNHKDNEYKIPDTQWIRGYEYVGTDTSMGREITENDRLGPKPEDAKYANLSEKSKVISIIEITKDLYKIKKDGDFFEVTRFPDDAAIRGFTAELLEMWPSGLKAMPERFDEKFVTLFCGNRTPHNISTSITRCSLYTDVILILNPFVDKMLYHPQYSALIRPSQWARIFAEQALFLSILQPWIENDIVSVIPNPVVLDFELMKNIQMATNARMDADQEFYDSLLHETNDDFMCEMFMSFTERDVEKTIETQLRPEDRARIRQKLEKYRSLDPQRTRIPFMSGQPLMFKKGIGFNLEMAQLIASGSGCSFLTGGDFMGKVFQVEAPQGRFQQVTDGFSKLKFNFLNDVPADFAIGVRNDGGLSKFRNYLMDISASVKVRDENPPRVLEDKEFCDRLESEYENYKSEWNDIQSKLGKFSIASHFVKAGAASYAFLTGDLGVAVPTFFSGAAGDLMLKLVDARFGRKALERKPINLMFKLDERQR